MALQRVTRLQNGGDQTICAMFSAPDLKPFSLVLGGEATIGFDATDWKPTLEEEASYEQTRREYEEFND